MESTIFTMRKALIFLIFFVLILIAYSYSQTNYSLNSFMSSPASSLKVFYINKTMNCSKDENTVTVETFTSSCECRKNDAISIVQYGNEYFVNVSMPNHNGFKVYKANIADMNSITCDAYNVLRRGTKQKVVGFSLYGMDDRYYLLLKGNNNLIGYSS